MPSELEIEELRQVEQAFEALELSPVSSSQDAAAILILAGASKVNAGVRDRLADPTVLKRLIEIVEVSLSDDLEITTLALKCIGNGCIDNETGRDAVTSLSFNWALSCLRNDDSELEWLTVKVLYNICTDHEKAQQVCYEEKIHYQLIAIAASSQALQAEDKSLLIDLLFWITGQKANSTSTQPQYLPADTLLQLVNLPYYHRKKSDIENFATLLEICLTFLRDPAIQEQIVETGLVGYVWLMLEECEKAYRAPSGHSPEAEELLKPLSASLTWCLSDIAAHPVFPIEYPLDDDFMQGLIGVIKTNRRPNLWTESLVWQDDALAKRLLDEATTARGELDDAETGEPGDRIAAAACQMVGNLIWKLRPDNFAFLVMQENLHEALWELVTDSNSGRDDLIYSATGLLVHLSRASVEVREEMAGSHDADQALVQLCRHSNPQIKQQGIRLLRALGKDSQANQRRFADLAASVTLENATTNGEVAEDTAIPD